MFKKYWPLLAIVLGGLVLRLYVLFHYGDLWADEMFSFVYSQRSWLQSWHLWTLETNPPLHLFLLKIWWYLVPPSATAARVPSLIIGIANIVALYRLGKRFFSERTALLSAAFLAFSPNCIFYAVTARGYALLILLATLYIDYFLRIFFTATHSKHDEWCFGIVALLLLYTHLTAWLLIISSALALLILKRAAFKKWFVLGLAPTALWLIWALPAAYAKFTMPSLGTAWFLNISTNFIDGVRALEPLFTGVSPWPFGLCAIVIFMIAAGAAIYRQKKSGPDPIFLALVCLSAFPILLAVSFGLWNIKFFDVAQPALLLMMAILATTYLPHGVLLALCVGAFYGPGLIALPRFLPLDDWTGVNTFLANRITPNEHAVFIYNDFVTKLRADYYLKTSIPAIPYYVYSGDWDENVVTKNYLRYLHTRTEVAGWLDKNNIEKNYTDIFLLEDTGMGVPISAALSADGWVLAEPPFYPRLLGSPELFHYVHR